jgi:hypothetical protein
MDGLPLGRTDAGLGSPLSTLPARGLAPAKLVQEDERVDTGLDTGGEQAGAGALHQADGGVARGHRTLTSNSFFIAICASEKFDESRSQ